MSFPVPHSSVVPNGEQQSHEQLANKLSEQRRAEQIQYALRQKANQPSMIRTIDPPSEQELARQRNERIRRQGNNTSDFRWQLEALAQEGDDIRVRLESYRRQRAAALREGRMGDAKALRDRVETAELELEQMALLQEEAEAGLAAAEAREADERRVLRAQIPAAESTVTAYRKALETEFPQLAARLKELVDLEAQSDAATRLLRDAAMKIVGYTAPAAPAGPRLRGAMIIPGFIERPRAPINEGDLYAR